MHWTAREIDEKAAQTIAASLNLTPPTSRVLASRGLTEIDEVQRYLEPSLHDLHDPFLLEPMKEATTAIGEVIRQKGRILIFGDYDVDGISGSAILQRVLRLLGGDVEVILPSRLTDGYSLTDDVTGRILAREPAMLITVDNGITALEGAQRIAETGIEMVIVDHHEPTRELPRARAILDPKLPGSTYPYRDLCATGVAFKLAWALCQDLPGGGERGRQILLDSLGLVALGTVADVSPLTGENRVLVAFGLRTLANTSHPGMQALMAASRVRTSTLKAKDLAFRLGPLVNAPGRLGDPSISFRLVSSESPEEAKEAAKELARANRRRQGLQREVLAEARVQVKEQIAAGRPALVLAADGWHPGVTGIVAGRLTRETNRPTILVTLEEDRGRGSARAIGGAPLPDLLDACGDLLVSHGGHARAAGLVLKRDRLDTFRERFWEAVEESAGSPTPRLVEVDTEVRLSELRPRTVQELDRMAPFGEGNPAPLLVSRGCRVAGSLRPGPRGRKSLAFYLRQDDVALKATIQQGEVLREMMDRKGDDLTAAFRPRMSNGGEVDLDVVALPDDPPREWNGP
jgi:single-stranded-DNA-specific exonuclease